MQRTVFFDLGNVLLYFDTLKMYQQIARLCSLDLEEVTTAYLHHIDSCEKGSVNTQKLHENFTRLAKKEIDLEEFRHALGNIFKPNEQVIDIVKELKNSNTRLFVLSNTQEAHFEFALDRFPFLQLFDGYVLSYKVGARKPDKKIFEEALRIADCKKQECFYTDDIPAFVHAAQALKIDAAQFTTPENLRSDLYQRNLLQK
ncbi:MAG TPA: HAD family phosphatase [Rhabdochlamydiaceae bacterium]|jgi:putative hydrolase of the HAD superfamily